jgi:undecaprenyl-diphosphatase
MLDKLLDYDRELLIYLNGLGKESYDWFWILVTNELNWIPIFAIVLVSLFVKLPRKEFWRTILLVFIILLFTLFLTEIAKELIHRLRPNQDPSINGLIRAVKHPTNYSFFSGHASTSFAIVTYLVLTLRRRLWGISMFFIWPLVFASSRVYLGVHYPLDIVAGSMVGIGIGSLFYWLVAFKLHKIQRALN